MTEHRSTADEVRLLPKDSSAPRRRTPWTALFIGLGLFLTLVALAEYIIRIDTAREQSSTEKRVIAESAAVRAGLEAELNSTIYVAVGLAGYIAVNPRLDPESVDILLPTIYRYGRHLRNIGLAPGNRITYIYPREGNEAAIGLQYEDHPDQWPAVERAQRTRQTVLAGPIDLAQGGRALANRTPVYLPDGTYWGIISLVINLDSVLHDVATYSRDTGVNWAVRSTDGNTPVFGDQTLFTQKSMRQTIVVPGGTWEMAAAPNAGWHMTNWFRYASHGIGIATALVISLLVFLVMSERGENQYIAAHDPLTGLPGRTLFIEHLNHAITDARERNAAFTMLCIYLEGFSKLNARHGHDAGDYALRETAARLSHLIRDSDTIARIAGDEFMVILHGVATASEAKAIAAAIETTMAKPIRFGFDRFTVPISIGIGQYPDGGTTPDALMRHAEEALLRVTLAKLGDNTGAETGGGIA